MIAFIVNGKHKEVDVGPGAPLLWILREHLRLTGTKFGCGIAACGACTVHLDGEPVRACATIADQVHGHAVTTIEGLSHDGTHALQKAWVAEQVPQCGYCQSGQIMSAAALLASESDAERDHREYERQYGTYLRIIAAIQRAARAG